MHFFLMCAVKSTYLCELFLFPTPWDEGSLMDVRIWGLALKLACQEALLLCAVQVGILQHWYLNLHLSGVRLPMKWSLEREGWSTGWEGVVENVGDRWRFSGKSKGKDMPGQDDSLLLLFFFCLSFYHPIGEEYLRERGFKSCAPVKAAIIITLRGWTVAA